MLLIVGFNYDVSITFWDKLGNRSAMLLFEYSLAIRKLQSIQNNHNPVCLMVIWALLTLTGTEFCTNYNTKSLPVYSLNSVLITNPLQTSLLYNKFKNILHNNVT